MDVLPQLAHGFGAALSPTNLLMAVVGSLLGTLVGVLPGLGPTAAIAILFPLTTVLPPVPAIIMLAAIYYGAMYGGSTTAILLNIPGEVASVPTCLDGYPMARQGRGGVALGISAIGSFFAGMLGVTALTFFAPFLADQALRFGPPEYFGLMVLAFTVVASLSSASLVKGFAMAALGYFLSLIGLGPSTAEPRFTFGWTPLMSGVELIALVVGLFALSEVFLGLEQSRVAIAEKITNVFPRWADLKEAFPAILRGTGIGFFLGLLPGCAPGVTVFMAYDAERRIAKHPERFGRGAIEGVASPESANNATSSAGFIPLLALGIPASAPLAVLLGGLLVYGLQPGPLLFQKNPDFVWTVIASLYIGNIVLLILNLPLIGMWVWLTRIPYGILGPLILLLSVLGAYSVRNSMFDVAVSLVFGAIGYFLRKYQWPLAPLLLAFILGPLLEKYMIQSLSMSGGSPLIFFQRWLSLVLIVGAALLFLASLVLVRYTGRRVKEETAEELAL
ncbi:MAG: transporter [Candidatus Rokubacteria bacterium RIFCSPHIGHO2_12_FULL_73_22]|nr:MAG: transporter [Candidatus Rokubacteria bacterium RIFCSPHIGHO2_02_FULL_73_26]OGL03873.1 MAG: transporter [Candidatus Rokubacteria bacterium RIFCSPHIGHO2_12_FULL_73_22]OGL10974.1 MAG: transporter [Candidatus Rokubacteria bacterium RIFCSPLOWO2_02_FULL_73_56]OGL28599.1 MAG: transporter [Candidatus Rokubacteria bacterium RIFCSPLOWO2_12_FULL_73_47]